MRALNKSEREGPRRLRPGRRGGRKPTQPASTEHRSYIHRENGESSLRCSCGHWRGRNLVDHDGHAQHAAVASSYCSVCGDPADTDPCSTDCRKDLALIQGHYCDYPEETR